MNYKYQINSAHEAFVNFLLDIKSYFLSNTQTIHKARNELKIINYNGVDTVVKSFKQPHFLNRIIYTFFRDSKAKKSYEYSLKIGNFTPTPIGYIEFYESSLLKESFFISEEFRYDFTIREPLLDASFAHRDEIFKAFGEFTHELHEAGILHQDYSPGNILIKQENSDFIFKIVDINRMEFRELTLEEKVKNFSKLWASDEALTTMLKAYAKVANEDEKRCVERGLFYNTRHKNRINMKKRLKGVKVVD